ncbi:alpha-glucosidase [Sphingomonas oleivorans]|uniref:Alpha-glucosidase n=2 Tax=Sphingomonas oleivorans TaxID=1735121 RepID=A0A2T5G3A1_9SPHN|nr:alpha-glucosidase [Sphingomonas oleivorans]
MILPWASLAAQQPVAAPASAATPVLTPLADGIDVRTGAMLMRVTALDNGILRVRVGRDGQLPEDASWAVTAATRQRAAKVEPFSDAASAGFRTSAFTVRIDRRDGRLTVEDPQGKPISSDAALEPVDFRGTSFTVRKTMPADAHYYGLGDKAGPLDRRGQTFTLWNTDAFLFQESTDPLYKAIPFFISVDGEGRSHGLFLDNTWRSWFDFGRIDPDALSFGAEGGPIDYYILAGPTPKDVVQRYAALTGTSPMPPQWTLGFQQSRYSYMSADEVRAIASRFRAEHIPLDAIWLDIDYQDRNRPFSANKGSFPDLAGLVRDVARQDVKIVAITDLHVANAPGEGYKPYDTGAAGDHFVRDAAGKIYSGTVWPGPSVFPEFTRAPSRTWWGSLYKDFVADGVAGFWNDMNEPSIFETATKTMPLDNQHRIEEPGFAARIATHREIHNVFGMLNSRATYDGLLALKPNERPYVLTRASYAGGQRYASTWSGDNSSTWNHLRQMVPQLLNLGMSGFAYSGVDIGGFAGTPNADLLTRWIAIGAFTPVYRDHTAKGTAAQEPWVHGPEHGAIRRRYIEERYRLLPYLYALANETERTGLPIMRPVFLEYPDALSAPCDGSMNFLMGDRMLVAPGPWGDSPAHYFICLPKGEWFDYWTGKKATPAVVPDDPAAPSVPVLRETPTLERLPVFVRAGTILPRQPLVQSTAETPKGRLELAVYPGSDCRGTLYFDDGHSLDYRRGAFLRQQLRCTVAGDRITLSFDRREGRFQPWWKEVDLVIHGWSGASARATMGGRTLASTVDAGAGLLRVTLPDPKGAATVELATGG